MLMRSVLSVPGIRPNMIEKAPGVPADVICLDLEDSVPLAEKPRARQVVAEQMARLDFGARGVMVRVNALATGLTEDDLLAVVAPKLQLISLPKVEGAEQVRAVDAILSRLERERGLPAGQVKIVPWIELAIAVINVYPIATASSRVVGLLFGAEDFTNDMAIPRTADGHEIEFPRAAVAIAARAAGVTAIDTPETDFRNLEHLERDALHARSLGFEGKFCIHPGQLEIVNRIFSPDPDEVAYARRVVEAYEEGERRGIGAVALDGKMIDAPVVRRARQLLARAEAMGTVDNRPPSTVHRPW